MRFIGVFSLGMISERGVDREIGKQVDGLTGKQVDKPNTHQHGCRQQRKIDQVMLGQTFDRARKDFLQFTKGNETPGKCERAEQDLQRENRHRERVD